MRAELFKGRSAGGQLAGFAQRLVENEMRHFRQLYGRRVQDHPASRFIARIGDVLSAISAFSALYALSFHARKGFRRSVKQLIKLEHLVAERVW